MTFVGSKAPTLLAECRIITVSFPVDGESRRRAKGNTEEKLAHLQLRLDEPGLGCRLKLQHFGAKRKHVYPH